MRMETGETGKGLFAPAASYGLALRDGNRAKARKQLDDFAELLAEGATPSQAAVAMGYLPDHGRVMLRRICKRLGPQAI